MFRLAYAKETGLFLFAFCVRLAVFIFLWQWFIAWGHSPQFGSQFPVTHDDSLSYYRLAQNLLNYHSYSTSVAPPLLPESFRLPGYPFFIFAFEWLGLPVVGVMVLQMLLSSGSVVLTYLFGKKFLSEKSAFMAALLFCIEPTSVFFSTTVMSDTLFVFAFLLGLYLFLRPPSASWQGQMLTFAGGLSFGFAILTRAIAQYLPFFLIIGFLLLYRKELRPAQRTVVHLAAFCIGIVLVLAPWSLRNYQLYRTFDLSSTPYVTFAMDNLPLFYAYTHHVSFVQAAVFYSSTSPTYTSLANKGLFEKMIADNLRGHLGSYIYFDIIKTIPFFVTDGLRDMNRMTGLIPVSADSTNFSDLVLHKNISGLWHYITSPEPNLWLLLAGSIPWIIITCLWLFETAYAIITRQSNVWFICIASGTVLYLAVLTGPIAEHRYRMPAVPFMLLLAAEGAVTLWTIVKKRNLKS